MPPVAVGAGIVLGVSLLERLVLDLTDSLTASSSYQRAQPSDLVPEVGGLRRWQADLDLPASWYGWDELANFMSIRHCFAHEFGRMTSRQRGALEEFRARLGRGEMIDRDGKTVAPYYELGDGEVSLDPGALNRFRQLSNDLITFLKEKGLTVEV